MTALVLSAGGMYGAYQAGAWKAIAEVCRPDIVVGASIGAMNGWAIAGGCDPDDLIDRWLNLDAAARYRWKFPRSPVHGVFDTTPLQAMIRDVYDSFQPRTHFAMVLTDLMKLRPVVLHGNEVSWQHLVAGTAIVGLFDQVRLGGRIYSDGGLLSAVPLWAAAEMGATRVLGHRCSSHAAGRHRPHVRWRYAVALAVSRACSVRHGSNPAGAARAARQAARIHLLDPLQRRSLDPCRPGTGHRDKTFHCELF